MNSLLCGLVYSVIAACLFANAAADSKIVQFSIARHSRSPSSVPLAKRDYFPSILTNGERQPGAALFYYLNITIGTPPQNFGVDIDTGSSDLWIITATDTADCEEPRFGVGCGYGLYNQNVSSTYALVESGGFFTEYADGSVVTGDFITEDVGFGADVIVKQQLMALANSTTGNTVGLMGVGLDVREAGVYFDGDPVYPSIIDELQSQGFINVKAYSLWLDDSESSTGSILFGGVDRSKYLGELVALPIQLDPFSHNLTSFTVSLTGIGFVDSFINGAIYTGAAIPAILDSGTSITIVPDFIASTLYAGIGVTVDNNTSLGVVPCALNATAANISFTFGGPSGPCITVALSEFVSDPYLNADGSILQVDNENVCQFGLVASGDNFTAVLGDTFLRSAYVVYDLDNLVIGIANTNSEPGLPNIAEYSVGQLSIPCVTSTATETVSYYVQPTGPTITRFATRTFSLSDTPDRAQAMGKA